MQAHDITRESRDLGCSISHLQVVFDFRGSCAWCRYEAEVELMTREEWQDMLPTLYQDLVGEDGMP